MVHSEPADLLKRVLFLRHLTPEERIELAEVLPRETYAPGETIIAQGGHPDSLYIILDGEAEVLRGEEEGEWVSLGRLAPGDTIGALEMIYRQPRPAAVRSVDTTVVLRWDRALLTQFMKTQPAALKSLQFIAQSHKLAKKLSFSWLREGEVIYALARKHSFVLFQRLTIPVLMLGGASALILWALLGDVTIALWGGFGLGLAGIIFGIWQWLDWTNDYYIVTDRRAVWLEKVIGIYDSRREAPLHTILSVSVGTDITGRMMGFGDVVIRTYTGKVVFHNVGEAQTIAALIEANWQRQRAKQDSTDRESLVEALEQRLQGEEPQIVEESLTSLPDETESPPTRGMGRWGFKVRFEDEDTITYRKHWAVLLREISVPSGLFIFVIGLLGARLGGLISILSPGIFLLLSIAALMVLSAWWLYRYVDWANDIYQITAQQIIDIYKKPLAREERKVAPIENILGTEVDRKGLIGILLNYGDVVANVGTAQFVFKGVFDPVTIQQDIAHAQEALLLNKAERARFKRQGEMVELFDIYHDKYTQGDSEDGAGNSQPYGNSRDRHPTKPDPA
ncbi:MAG: cyclic nucleotide-binding domain-containing protein [Anaerolineales bacterium]|nr:cyclic nucleotide-binding domain-containing protein [Anaerolineales bacterium]